MRLLPLLLCTALGSLVPAQAHRIVERVEAPMLYLSMAGLPQADAAAAPGGRDALQRLLADPGLGRLMADPQARAGGSAAAVMSLLGSAVARGVDEIELALTGIAPRADGAGQPLLVLRAELRAEDADRMRTMLADGRTAVPSRRIGEHPVYALASSAPKGTPKEAGYVVEIALVARELLVANHAGALEELLQVGATTATPRQVLAADPRFRELRTEVAAQPGALFLYGDWPRLGKRLTTAMPGLSGSLVAWSGLGEARSVVASLAAGERGLHGTVLVDFAANTGIDGWLDAVTPVPARTLLDELPLGGLGSVVLALDPVAVMRSGAGRGRGGIQREIAESMRHYGLDFEKHVLNRLGTCATLQLLFQRSEAAPAPAVLAAYAFHAKNKKAANDIFQDLARSAQGRGSGRVVAAKERRGSDVLVLSGHHDVPGDGPRPDGPRGGRGPGQPPERPLHVAVVEDSLLVAYDRDVVQGVLDAMRAQAKNKNKRDAAIVASLQTIGGEKVAGLFDLDLGPFFDSVARSLGETGAPVDLTGIPVRHTGYLDVRQGERGAVVRLRVLSSR